MGLERSIWDGGGPKAEAWGWGWFSQELTCNSVIGGGKWLLNPSIITGSLQEFPPPESCYTPDAVQIRWLVILGRAGSPWLEALQPRPEDHFEGDVLPASWAGS